MTKYVIDLPAAATVIVAKNPFLPNETDLMRIPVSQLELYVEPTVAENAPVEKRVIELPVELFNYLLKIKKTHRGGISHFMGDAIKKRLIIQDLDTEDVLKDEMLVDWYLHPELVEFVPKKEPKFYIRVVDVFDADGNDLYLASMGNNEFRMTIYTDRAGMFTEEEADKIIADVSNSDVSLTARKVKVDE
mgnify:CR=1 FL=1